MNTQTDVAVDGPFEFTGKGGEYFRDANEYRKKAPKEFARMEAAMKDWRRRLVEAVKAW